MYKYFVACDISSRALPRKLEIWNQFWNPNDCEMLSDSDRTIKQPQWTTEQLASVGWLLLGVPDKQVILGKFNSERGRSLQ